MFRNRLLGSCFRNRNYYLFQTSDNVSETTVPKSPSAKQDGGPTETTKETHSEGGNSF